MFMMARLETPIICVVIGEGGSGGALGIGVGDKVAVLEHSYYSVISPEGCAGILWKSHTFKEQAAQALKLTSKYLQGFGVVDDIIEEPLGGRASRPSADGSSDEAISGQVAEGTASQAQGQAPRLALRQVPPDGQVPGRCRSSGGVGSAVEEAGGGGGVIRTSGILA
jgi:acetyl-CoA carboxylase alpha subunit